MPKVLKLAQLVKNHQVPKGQIRARRVDTKFNAQGLATVQTVFEFSATDDSIGVTTDDIN